MRAAPFWRQAVQSFWFNPHLHPLMNPTLNSPTASEVLGLAVRRPPTGKPQGFQVPFGIIRHQVNPQETFNPQGLDRDQKLELYWPRAFSYDVGLSGVDRCYIIWLCTYVLLIAFFHTHSHDIPRCVG